jgi:AbrB family looped-hinge helix DNA binding protein
MRPGGLGVAFTVRYDGKGMSRLSTKNQVTIPVNVLREAGIEPGDEVEIRATAAGRIEIEAVEDLVARFAGALPPGTYPPNAARDLGREWER